MPTKILMTQVLLCFVEITASSECRSFESIHDHALFRHIHKLISGIRIESCAARCDADPFCYSFNYIVPDKACELNNATRATDSEDFLCRSSAVYFNRLKAPHDFCEASPCNNNGTCKVLNRAPGFECSCRNEYSGETCESK